MDETYIPGFSQQLMRSASAPAGYATGGNVRLATPEETAKAVKNVTAVSQSDPIYKNASALEAGTPVYYLPNPAAGSMYKDQTPITADGRTYELTDKTGKVVFTAKTDAELKQLVDLVNNEYNADKTTAAWNVRVAQARPTMVARRGNLEDFSGGVRRVAQGKLTPVQQYDTIAGAIPDPNTFAKWAAIALPMAGGIALGPALAGGLGVGSAVGTGLGTALGSTAAGTIAGKSIGDILKGALISGGLAYGGASLLGGGSPTPSGGDALETIMNAPVTFGGDAGALASGTLGGAAGSVGGSTAGTDALGNFIQVVAPKAGGTVGGALGGVLGSYPNLNGTAQTPFQQNPPTQQQPQQQETPTDGNEIVVTGGKPGFTIPTETAALLATYPALAGTMNPPTAPGSTTTPKKGLSTYDYIRLASLGIGTLGQLFGGNGGSGSGATISGNMGALNPVFGKQLPATNIPGLAAGTTGPRDMTGTDWYRYGYGPEQSFFNAVPQRGANTSQAYTGYAEGGSTGDGMEGALGRYVEGPGDGRADEIPAMLSDGEYVMDAETVALLGNGSNKAGADLLDQFRVNIRKHKGRELSRGEFSDDAKRPEHYMAGGRM